MHNAQKKYSVIFYTHIADESYTARVIIEIYVIEVNVSIMKS